jgi:hypothetical protein
MASLVNMTAHERQVFFADDVSIVSGDNSVQEYEEKYTDVAETCGGMSLEEIISSKDKRTQHTYLRVPIEESCLSTKLGRIGTEKIIDEVCEDIVPRLAEGALEITRNMWHASINDTFEAARESCTGADVTAAECFTELLEAVTTLVQIRLSVNVPEREQVIRSLLTKALEPGGKLCTAVDADTLENGACVSVLEEKQCAACERREATVGGTLPSPSKSMTQEKESRKIGLAKQSAAYMATISDRMEKENELEILTEETTRKTAANISDRREKDDEVDNVTAVLERTEVLLAASIDDTTVTGELTKMKAENEAKLVTLKSEQVKLDKLETRLENQTKENELLLKQTVKLDEKSAKRLLNVQFSDGTVKSRDIQVSLADFPKEVKERNPATARAAEYWLYKTLRVNFKQVPTLMGIGMLLRDERNIINPLRVPLVQQDNSGTARLVYFDSNGEHSDTIFGTGVRLSEAFEEKYMAESKEIWDLLVTIGAGNTDLREMLQTCNSVLKSGGIDVNGQPLRESSAQEGDGIGFIHWFRHYHESTVHRRSKAMRKVLHNVWSVFVNEKIVPACDKVLKLLTIGRNFSLQLEWAETIQVIAIMVRERSYAKFAIPLKGWIEPQSPYEYDCLDQFIKFIKDIQAISRVGTEESDLTHTDESRAAYAACESQCVVIGDPEITAHFVRAWTPNSDNKVIMANQVSTAQSRWMCCEVTCKTPVKTEHKLNAKILDPDYDKTHVMWCETHLKALTNGEKLTTKSTAPGGTKDIQNVHGQYVKGTGGTCTWSAT